MATKRKPVPKVRADGRGNLPKSEPEPIELTNLACPRCDTALHYTPSRWLYCPRCTSTPKLGTN